MEGEGLIPSAEVRQLVNESMSVCADMNPKDFTDWERFLTPENDPRNWLRREWQHHNDCCANSGTTGSELCRKRSTGILGEQSRMFLYQQCELIDRKLGRDKGVSIPAAVKVLRDKGCPLESEYPYNQYVYSERQLASLVTTEILESAAQRRIEGAIPAPPAATARVHLAIGNPIHWGHWWGLSFRTEEIAPGVTARVVRNYRRSHGSDLHATEVVWPIKTPRGEWMFATANSHNDGYFYVPEDEYEAMKDPSFNPCGAYVLMRSEDPVRQYEGQFSAMG